MRVLASVAGLTLLLSSQVLLQPFSLQDESSDAVVPGSVRTASSSDWLWSYKSFLITLFPLRSTFHGQSGVLTHHSCKQSALSAAAFYDEAATSRLSTSVFRTAAESAVVPMIAVSAHLGNVRSKICKAFTL